MILFIDNYDSFTYNLVQMVGGINPDLKVVRNDALTVQEIAALGPSHIILSPGPGYPRDAGVCEAAVPYLAGQAAILGVCLGHQGICEVYGSRIEPAQRLMHGKQSRITIDNTSPIFRGLPGEIDGARYHSLAARRSTVPPHLKVIAVDQLGEVMAVKHRDYDIYGLQFHPESILTPDGEVIVNNFLRIQGGKDND